MNRLFRLAGVVAAILLVGAALVACSSPSSTATPTPAASSAATAAATTAPGGGGGNGSDGGTASGSGGGGDAGGGSGKNVSPTPGTTTLFTVTQGGKTLKTWTLEELQAAVTFTSITVDGDQQNGPLLKDVLAASGVTSWAKGEVDGRGPSRSFDVAVPIDPSQVNDTWIIDITKRGTVKLAADNLPREQWVRDITEIKLQ